MSGVRVKPTTSKPAVRRLTHCQQADCHHHRGKCTMRSLQHGYITNFKMFQLKPSTVINGLNWNNLKLVMYLCCSDWLQSHAMPYGTRWYTPFSWHSRDIGFNTMCQTENRSMQIMHAKMLLPANVEQKCISILSRLKRFQKQAPRQAQQMATRAEYT